MQNGRVADHLLRVVWVIAETMGIAIGLGVATAFALKVAWPLAVVPIVLQGFWMQRFYVVGHYAAHSTLLPDHPWWNDTIGQAALLVLLVPLRVFRKIHAFHHGANRRDIHTSALDTFVVPRGAGALRRMLCRAQWYAAVFGGGWFVHSLASILLFLFLPLSLARRVSPAFKGWRRRDQFQSLGVFGLAVVAHGAAIGVIGVWGWVTLFVAPLIVFAWQYSAQLYIYHHDTTIGPQVRYHARAVRGPLLSWWLMNLNEHATHHRVPRVVWYAIPSFRQEPPLQFAENRDVRGFWRAISSQLNGPRIVEAP